MAETTAVSSVIETNLDLHLSEDLIGLNLPFIKVKIRGAGDFVAQQFTSWPLVSLPSSERRSISGHMQSIHMLCRLP